MEKDKILAARKNSPHKQRPGHAQSTANTPRKETARKLVRQTFFIGNIAMIDV
jgi:hypothetical protein